MIDPREAYFHGHPEPMWVYDTRTLRFLDINRAAVVRYGYTREEFLAMRISDIRPEDDVEALRESIRSAPEGDIDTAGIWRHRLKSGRIIHVAITSHPFPAEQGEARIVSARDVSQIIEHERERARLLERERKARRQAEAAVAHFQALFEAAPGRFVVIGCVDELVTTASDDFLALIGRDRREAKGRRLFDILPHPDANGESALRASFRRVGETGAADTTGPLDGLLSAPQTRDSSAPTWQAVNIPLRDADGRITFLICRFMEAEPTAPDDHERGAMPADDPMALDMKLRSREHDHARQQLQRREALLRNAQRLARLGHWELDLRSSQAHWSAELYDLFGVDPATYGNTRSEFLELLHPDDRAGYIAAQRAAIRDGRTFQAEFRVPRADGTTRTMREVGEIVEVGGRPVLSVLTQDITDIREVEAEAARNADLLRLAGRMARMGGWRVEMDPPRITWTAGTAAIHDLPEGSAPTLEEAFDYYIPEQRARIRAAFDACAEAGTPFDETLQIVSAAGTRKWVRAIGEAERDGNGAIKAVRGAFQDISETVAMRRESAALAQRLRHTLENLSDGFMTLDGDWRFSFLNTKAETLLGRRAGELLGRNVWEEFPEAVTRRFKRDYEAAMRDRRTVRFTEYYPAPLNAWFQVSAYPTGDGLAIHFRDVTRERADQQQLRLLEAAVARQNDILLITDGQELDAPHGPVIAFVNDAFEKTTGFSREEALGQTPRFLQGPGTQRDELDRIRRAMEAGRPVRSELRNYRRDGSEIWLEVDITPLTDEAGAISHFVAIERDITDRKAAEAALRLSEERFRLLARATHDVVWDWDVANDIVWWNENMEATFGYDPSRVYRGPEAWDLRIHPEDRARVTADFGRMLRGSRSSWEDEYRYLRADGTVAHVVDRCFIMRDETGRAVRVLGSMTDVTERKMAEQRRRQSQKMEAIGQLTGGVSHDMNNLLTVILGNAEILSDELADRPRLLGMVDSTIAAAERGAQLTHRLLAFARQQPLVPKPVDVNTLVAGMESLLRRTLQVTIEVAFSLSDDLWISNVDPGQLELGLLNIALNAQDAMPDGGHLTIETANARLDRGYAASHIEVEPGEYVTIAISDTGSGMTPEVRDRAFDPFFTTKGSGKGTGLGLSMVYGLAKQSGGHAKIYSEPGEGTTVKLYLPRTEGGDAQVPEPLARPDIAGGDEHILVVEDDDSVRAHLTSLLRELGYRVTSAGKGPEALEILRQAPDIDLLFTDIVIPGGMNGRELAEAATALRPEMRVLFTSGYTENAIIHRGRLDEGLNFLGKPYRRQELARKLREVLDS
ncbi:hypothetical protein C2I36_10605 [Rhodobacteraceae bacterium WD3A24]|nr:hypothetical protein C2I36_10605 [Rhodobacteraceae bacterium WD3A24]